MKLSYKIFLNVGLGIIERNADPPLGAVAQRNTQTNLRHFKSLFGVHWMVCETLWNLLDDHGRYRETRKPEHLLWTLLFLKCYSSEQVHCTLVRTTAKTYRKWVWRVVEEISGLNTILVSGNDLYFL